MSNDKDIPDYSDEVHLLAEGEYNAKIIGFGEWRPSHTRPIVFLPVQIALVEHKDKKLFQFIPFYITAYHMIEALKKNLIDKTCTVSIKHKQSQNENQIFLGVSIHWDSLCH